MEEQNSSLWKEFEKCIKGFLSSLFFITMLPGFSAVRSTALHGGIAAASRAVTTALFLFSAPAGALHAVRSTALHGGVAAASRGTECCSSRAATAALCCSSRAVTTALCLLSAPTGAFHAVRSAALHDCEAVSLRNAKRCSSRTAYTVAVLIRLVHLTRCSARAQISLALSCPWMLLREYTVVHTGLPTYGSWKLRAACWLATSAPFKTSSNNSRAGSILYLPLVMLNQKTTERDPRRQASRFQPVPATSSVRGLSKDPYCWTTRPEEKSGPCPSPQGLRQWTDIRASSPSFPVHTDPERWSRLRRLP